VSKERLASYAALVALLVGISMVVYQFLTHVENFRIVLSWWFFVSSIFGLFYAHSSVTAISPRLSHRLFGVSCPI
jgi:hypothetical protein